MKRKLTNQGKAAVYATVALLLYIVPFIIVMIYHREKIFKSPKAALSLFSITALCFVLFFLKNLVKTLCKILTPIGFGSLIALLVSLALTSYLTLIATASVIGSVLAWYPYQLAATYSRHSKDENGDVIKAAGMDFKTANDKLFQISISVKE